MCRHNLNVPLNAGAHEGRAVCGGVRQRAEERLPAIGLMTELSGLYGANGADCREGYRLAGMLYDDSRKAEIFFGDTQGDAKTAVKSAEIRRRCRGGSALHVGSDKDAEVRATCGGALQ